MAAQYNEMVERVVLCGSGVSMEEKDLKEGIFPVNVEEAVNILVPQTPERLKELLGFTLSRPSTVAWLPSCLFTDYIDYCRPPKIVNNAENLGEVLRGDRIENSVYTFKMRKEQSCIVACRVTLDAESAKNFQEKIDDEYRVNMILDNLPLAVLRQRRDGGQSTTYEHGFRAGFKGNYQGSKEEKYFINNHLSCRVMYHEDPETDTARIVGFEVTPNRDHVEERREMILAIAKGRKLSDLPRVSQPTLLVWGERDQVFPLELAHRLKKHLGDNAELVVIKNTGHALNVKKGERGK